MSDAPKVPPYQSIPDAPLIYFDLVAAQGVLNGVVQVELARRHLVPETDGVGVSIEVATCARLRCSPHAALQLRAALDSALAMLQQPQEPQAGTVN